MAERSKAAVLKTVEVQASLGSNPNLSARTGKKLPVFLLSYIDTWGAIFIKILIKITPKNM